MLETVKKEEDERKMRLKKKEKLEERNRMVRWISKFIDENSEFCEADKIEKEYSREKEMEEWKKFTRLEKIKVLQQQIRENYGNDKPETEREKLRNQEIWNE